MSKRSMQMMQRMQILHIPLIAFLALGGTLPIAGAAPRVVGVQERLGEESKSWSAPRSPASDHLLDPLPQSSRSGRPGLSNEADQRPETRPFPLSEGRAGDGESTYGLVHDVAEELDAAQDAQAIDPGAWMQTNPGAAGDSSGNAYAVWEDHRDGDPHIRFAERPAGGDWQPSLKIDPTASDSQISPQIAADGAGNLYAIWQDARGGTAQIRFARRPAGGDWQTGEPVAPSGQTQDRPALAVNRRGDVAVTWRQGTWPTYHTLCAMRSAGGTWDGAVQLTEASANIATSDVALDDWGRIYVAWGVWDTGRVAFANRSPEGSWSDKEDIRDSTIGPPWGVQIAVDSSGNAHAVWEDGRSGGSEIYTAYRPAGGSWSVNVRLDNGNGNMWSPGLGIDGAGNAVAAWSEENTDVHAAVHYVGSGWTPSTLVVEGPASLRAHLADQHTLSPMSPEEIQSWLPGLSVAGPAGTILSVAASPLADLNVLSHDVGSPGANGCENLGAAATAAAQTLLSKAGAQGNADPCRAGNGGQEPPVNGDQGDAPPHSPPSGRPADGWPIKTVEIGGKVFFVVDTPGTTAIFTINQADEATAFSQSYSYTPSSNDPPDPPAAPAPSLTDLAPEAGGEGDLGLLGGGQAVPDVEGAQGLPLEDKIKEVAELFAQQHAGEEGLGTPAEIAAGWIAGVPFTMESLEELEFRIREDLQRKEMLARGGEIHSEIGALLGPPWKQAVPPADWEPTNLYMLIAEVGEFAAEVGMQVAEDLDWEDERFRRYNSYAVESIMEAVAKDPEAYKAYLESLRFIDPILLHSGEFVLDKAFLRIPGRGLDYAFRLTYHSQLIYDGPLGWGWEHGYDRRFVATGGGSLALREANGRFDVYTFDGADFTPPAGRYTTLISTTGGITMTDRHGGVEGYYPLDGSFTAGHLRTTADRNGNALRFSYDGQGRLQTVIDTLGREISYAYDTNDRINAVTDFAGRSVTLAYDANGDLVSITTPAVTGTPHGNDFPVGKTTVLSYTSGFDDARLNHNLTTIIAPNEVADGSMTPRTINTYGAEGFAFDRVVHQSWGGGRANASGIPAGGAVTLAYTTSLELDAPAGAASKTMITDRGGNVTEFWHDGAGHRLRSRLMVDGAELVTDHTYNSDGQIASVTYPAGNRTVYSYDDGAADRFAQGNLLEQRNVADDTRGCDGAGSTPCLDLVTSYTYEPSFQQLESGTDANNHTAVNTYDVHGNLVRVDLPDITVGPAAAQSASQSWTYNPYGQPLTFTNPEGNVTCHTYYDSGPAEGYRQAVTLDWGGADVTTEYGYDTVGNVTVITDARGIRTEYEVNALNQVVKQTRAAGALDYEILYWYDANDNVVRTEVENVAPDLDADFHPTGSHSRDAANPWLSTAYTYDLLDNLVRVEQEVAASEYVTTERRYDPLENLISVTDPEGNQTAYDYDERNLPIATSHAAGTPDVVTTTSHYDGNANLVRRVDGEGHPTDFLYDGFDRRVGRVDALGNVRIWAYDANGNILESVVRDGQDGRNPTRTITATTPVTLTHAMHQFDERNRRYAQHRAFFSADLETGTLTPITTDGDGDSWVETTATFDRNGNVVALTDDNGNQTTYVYDGLDHLVLTTDALSNTVAHSYDGTGNLIQTISTERQPDDLLSKETFTTTNTYDAVNRVAQTADNLGQTSRYAYDSRDNLVFTSDANGPVVGTGSGGSGRSTTEVVTTAASNNHGNTAVFTYDGLNRSLEETYHLREGGVGSGTVIDHVTMAYAYDGSGNLTHSTDPNGNVTAYGYDALNRRTGITYADGTTETMTYDRAHNLVERTDANGSVMAHTHDALNRRVRTDVTRGPGVGGTTLQTFAYDGLSRLVASSDDNGSATLSSSTSSSLPEDPDDGSTLTFTYDSLSNPISEIQNGDPVSATFDGVGNRLTLSYPGGTAVTATYEELNRISTIADGTGIIASYDYIGPSRTLRRTNANGTYTAYVYDGARRVTEVAHRTSSGDTLLSGFAYTYDRVGNHTGETAQHSGGTTTYSYDSLYRLTGAEGPDGDVSYTYDDAGNRIRVTKDGAAIVYARNQMHEYLSVDSETRTHDANGNLLSRRFSSTPQETWSVYLPLVLRGPTASSQAGRPILSGRAEPALPRSSQIVRSGGDPSPSRPPMHEAALLTSRSRSNETDVTIETLITYRYDADNRLLEVTEVITATDDGDVDVTSSAVRYTYDATGRLISTRADDENVDYLYAGRRVIEERDETDTLLAHYVAGLTMDRGSGRWFYQTDELGSVRALADETGAVKEHVDYDPFGAPVISGVDLTQETSSNQGETWPSMSALGNPYLFRGRRYDAGSDLYVYGGRRYDPEKGRYLQWGRETLGNPYTFAGNNPLSRQR